MIAAIYIAIVLDDGGMATCLGHGADARGQSHPTSQRGIKELDIDFAHILTHPFVEEPAHEVGVLPGRDGEAG